MSLELHAITLLVPDYDAGIAFYVGVLGFELREDSPVGPGPKRRVRVAPTGSPGLSLLLARADGPAQVARVGDQTGGRVFLFLNTDDLDRDRDAWTRAGVEFEAPTREEAYGRVAVFRDPFGNRCDPIQPSTETTSLP